MGLFKPPIGASVNATTLGGKTENQLNVASAITATTASNSLLLNGKASNEFALYSHTHEISPTILSVVGPINTPPIDDPLYYDYGVLTNGNFDTDLSGWTFSAGGNLSITSTTFCNTDTYDGHNYVRFAVDEAEGLYGDGNVDLYQSSIDLTGVACGAIAIRLSLNDDANRTVVMYQADNDGSNLMTGARPVQLTGTAWQLYYLNLDDQTDIYTSSQRAIFRIKHSYDGSYSAASYTIDVAYIQLGIMTTSYKLYLVGLNPTGAFSSFPDSLLYYNTSSLAWDETGNIRKGATK